MKFRFMSLVTVVLFGLLSFVDSQECDAENSVSPKAIVAKTEDKAIRIATFNVSLYRKQLGQLAKDLEQGDKQAEQLAKIIVRVNADIVLLNEIDDDNGKSAKLFRDRYLHTAGNDAIARPWTYIYTPTVNTGVDSGLDLDSNGKTGTPSDCWGYGEYPGQYGMAILSRYPIDEGQIRTFQNFLWSQMPEAMRPRNVDGKYYWNDSTWSKLRLSSKSHADVTINVDGQLLHLLVSHPTPPVFDGPEDRNGCRNHDEIRFWKDYVEWPAKDSRIITAKDSRNDAAKAYHVDDSGSTGGIPRDSCFVIIGDLNADPIDGSGIHQGIQGLLDSKQVNNQVIPQSEGAAEAARMQGKLNATHKADPATDTGDFNDGNPGNLRCDFVVPSANLAIVGSGVFWPIQEQLAEADKKMIDATDHRMVWIDVMLPAVK